MKERIFDLEIQIEFAKSIWKRLATDFQPEFAVFYKRRPPLFHYAKGFTLSPWWQIPIRHKSIIIFLLDTIMDRMD